MAAVDGVLSVIVDSLVSVRRTPFVRQHFHWLFFLLSAGGSVLKELDLVPDSYFSSSRNVLNVYLVKLSWGWTLVLLTPFLFLPHLLSGSRSVPSLTRHLLSLAVSTSVWYVCTETFFYIEDVTGFCHETGGGGADDIIRGEFLSKATCRRAGFHWSGWDISGHCFILSYSALVIMEETAHTACLDTPGLSHLSSRVLRLLYVALNAIVVTWVWMFFCTSVYFHDMMDKLLGTACGLLGWYLMYRVWYPQPWSPGLPSQRHPKERKQRA